MGGGGGGGGGERGETIKIKKVAPLLCLNLSRHFEHDLIQDQLRLILYKIPIYTKKLDEKLSQS